MYKKYKYSVYQYNYNFTLRLSRYISFCSLFYKFNFYLFDGILTVIKNKCLYIDINNNYLKHPVLYLLLVIKRVISL